MKQFLHITSALVLTLGLALPATAQDQDDEVVVTGSRIAVSQGGAADIEFFKESVKNGYLPAPSSITAEGLLYNYDLTLEAGNSCDQLFCLAAETMTANFVVPTEIDKLVGLGFATNLTHETWDRDPMTIVAVVDKSGSMDGDPLDIAKASMQEMLKHLRPGDRMAVVQYGSTTNVVIEVTDIATDRAKISEAIDSIESGGSTSMEAGLKLAYKTAFDAQPGFDGRTRVVLFTDEQPNVGATDSASFIGMAVEASKRGVGMTTFGVAEHFGADLANKISAARGGNLFYITQMADVPKKLGGDFDLIMTELAHDLKIKARPAKGVTIEEVFGVPGEQIKFSKDGSISFTVPSVFLSAEGGGVFLGVSGDDKHGTKLIDVSMSYVDAGTNKKYDDQLTVSGLSETISDGMKRAHLLVDEYRVLKEVTQASFFGEDMSNAEGYLTAIKDKLEADDEDKVYEEAELIEDYLDILEDLPEDQETEGLYSYYSEHEGSPVLGRWQVAKVRNQSRSIFGAGFIDIRKGDRIAFHLDQERYDETEIFNLRREKPQRGEAKFESESFGVDYDKREIFLYESDIKFDYRIRGDELLLYPEDTNLMLVLEPISPAP